MPSFIWRPSSLAEPLNGAEMPNRISLSLTPRLESRGSGVISGVAATFVGGDGGKKAEAGDESDVGGADGKAAAAGGDAVVTRSKSTKSRAAEAQSVCLLMIVRMPSATLWSNVWRIEVTSF